MNELVVSAAATGRYCIYAVRTYKLLLLALLQRCTIPVENVWETFTKLFNNDNIFNNNIVNRCRLYPESLTFVERGSFTHIV